MHYKCRIGFCKNFKKCFSKPYKNQLKSHKKVNYALATVDKDGKTQLSPIKIYKNKNALPKLIISLSPNPISGMGHLMLQFNADKKGVMIAKLIDMQGKVVLKTELSAEQGVNNGHIHLGDVPAGIYTIYFSLDGISESYRVVKKLNYKSLLHLTGLNSFRKSKFISAFYYSDIV